MYRPPNTAVSSDFQSVKSELPPRDALRAVSLRLLHVVDQCPKRNVIFEVDSYVSEHALVKIVEKLCSTFAQIDVIAADEEQFRLVAAKLEKVLSATTSDKVAVVETTEGGTIKAVELSSTWRRSSRSSNRSNAYSITIATLSHAMRAEFERDVREERVENRVIVLYRTETMLDGRGMLETQPVDTLELQITPLLYHIYRLVDLLDERDVLWRLRDYVKRYSDRYVVRFLHAHLEDLVRSARAARVLVQGTHFGFVQKEGQMGIIVTGSISSRHLAILQFLQIHHALPITPLRIPTLRRSPLNLLKAYGRIFGVFRRGGYKLRQWLPFLTQLAIYPSRVYPQDAPVTPIVSLPASVTISEWIVQVERLMGLSYATRMVPQRGGRIVVCPSTAALQQLWRYLKYSHDSTVARTTMLVCAGPTEQLERELSGRDSNHLVIVLTTAVHFETWNTRSLRDLDTITVFLGTASTELPYLHRAYRLARPVMNVITVPLEKSADRSPNDSGFESDSGSGAEEQRMLCAQALSTVDNRSHWARVFMMEMWGKGDWKAPLSCAEDVEYKQCVEWMRMKWREEKVKASVTGVSALRFAAWSDKMLAMYRREKKK